MLIAALTEWVRDAVAAGGYPALALLIYIENIFPPIPSEVILPLAGFYVGQGQLTYAGAVAAATVGSVAGALTLYAAARRGGRPLVLRHARLLRLTERDLDRADDWFYRRGWWIVLLGRMVPGARSLVSVPAGLSEMPVVRFTALTTAGSAAWNALLIGAGWALGANWKHVESLTGPVSTVVVCALVVVAATWVIRRRRRAARPT